MNRRIALLALCGAACLHAALGDGLVSYFNEDGVAHLDSIGGRHGAAEGETALVTGKVGSAHLYNGSDSETDSRVRSSMPGVAGWQAGTVSVWVRATLYPSGNLITIWQFQEAGSWGHKMLAIHPVTHQAYFHLATGQGAVELYSKTVLQDDKWYHLVAGWDKSGNTGSLYINGVLEAASSVPAWGPTSDNFYWGSGFNGYGMRGTIDEIGVWNRTLTEGEISLLFNGGSANSYPFDSPATSARFLQVPYYHQGWNDYCGYTSLSMLLAYHGTVRKPWEVAHDFDVPPADGGLRWSSWYKSTEEASPLMDYVALFGYRAEVKQWSENAYSYDTAGLKQYIINSVGQGRPVMMGLVNERHIVVVTGAGEKGVYIHDPSGATTGKAGFVHAFMSWEAFGDLFRSLFNLFHSDHAYTLTLDRTMQPPRTPVTIEYLAGDYDTCAKSQILSPVCSDIGFLDNGGGKKLMTLWDGKTALGYTTAHAAGARGGDQPIDAMSPYGRIVKSSYAPYVLLTMSNASETDQKVQVQGEIDEVNLDGTVVIRHLRSYHHETTVPSNNQVKQVPLFAPAAVDAFPVFASLDSLAAWNFVDGNPATIQYLRFTFSVVQGDEALDSFSVILAVNDVSN